LFVSILAQKLSCYAEFKSAPKVDPLPGRAKAMQDFFCLFLCGGKTRVVGHLKVSYYLIYLDLVQSTKVNENLVI
jgi:hypothetical protein